MSMYWICPLNYCPKYKALASHSSSESSSEAGCCVFWHSSSSASQLHSSVQTRLLDLQEHRREHVLLLEEEPQLHLTSCRTASGAGDPLLSTGRSLPLSFCHSYRSMSSLDDRTIYQHSDKEWRCRLQYLNFGSRLYLKLLGSCTPRKQFYLFHLSPQVFICSQTCFNELLEASMPTFSVLWTLSGTISFDRNCLVEGRLGEWQTKQK